MNQIKTIREKHFIKEWLDSLVKSDGVILTRKEWLRKIKVSGGYVSEEKYSSRKVNLTYAKLKKPKLSYNLHNDFGDSYEVPKIIFDNIQAILTEVQS